MNKKIRLIELFAGYGSQSLACKYLKKDYESYMICEWAVKSILAYKQIHFPNEHIEINLSREELANKLYEFGVSFDYNVPATLKQLSRKSLIWLKEVYEAILVTNNKVNIMNLKGKDLNIVDTDKYAYLMTYSFPCQDLSLAGKQKGMSDSSTRSGLLWQVERVLKECEDNKPQFLLMENVPQIHGKKNMEDFNKWINALNKLGYYSYYKDLNAKDYGIPQNRNRTFMVSMLINNQYIFPINSGLTISCKEILEYKVDTKYYVGDINKRKYSDYSIKKINENINKINNDIFCTLTANCMQSINHDNCHMVKTSNLGIRKLTPKECFRLMGVKDEDINKLDQSDSSMYHLAGDSIVVNVLMAIISNINFDICKKDKVKQEIREQTNLFDFI